MKTKFSLVIIYLYYLILALESQGFIPNNCFMPRNMTRINGLVRGFRPLLGWPQLSNDSVFLSLRLWFQKLKTTRLRKDKSFSVCFRKSKPNKIYVGGFWRELLICLSGVGLWVPPVFPLDSWSFALQHASKPSLWISSPLCLAANPLL